MSGETDNGLTFGASIDLDESVDGGAFNQSSQGGETIFISGSFGTVTMGDTDDAMDWALTEAGNVGNGGSIADDETSHAGYFGDYTGTNDQVLRWDYSFGDFGIAVSVDDDDATGDLGYAIGLKYDLDLGGTTVALGLGHQSDSSSAGAIDSDATGVSATASLANGFSVGVVYADYSGADAMRDSSVGIGLGYTTGALTLHANYGEIDMAAGGTADGFGLSAAYDLGGGAVVHFGYGDGTDETGVDADSFSLGLGLSF
jgi:outer membrane protein OmpU